MTLTAIGAGFLVVGGLINAIPSVAEHLSKLSGGKPILQVLIGIGSAVLGVILVSTAI